ncbi:MAG TPA: RDD family protein [Steroidobacteraceae bacterium]|nr:RDD family protein [Steroidobacteraceae bacterium]
MKPAIDTVIFAETPEGIAIALRAAGFPVRCCAFLIDGAIRYVVFFSIAEVLAQGGRMGIGLMLIVAFFVIWLYPVIFELMPAAATPGKRLLGIKVMMANGLPLTPAGSLIRNLLRAVDMLPLAYGFGILAMLLRPDARRLGDLAGGTLVVYRDQTPPAGDFGVGEPMPPPFALTARQQAAIARFAWRAPRLTAERAEEIAALAAAVVPGSKPPAASRLIGIARWQHGQRRTVVQDTAGRS